MDDFYIRKPRPAGRVRAEQNPGPHGGTAFSTDRGLKDSVPWPVHHWRVEDVETSQMEVWSDSDFRAEFDAVIEKAPGVGLPPSPPPGEAPQEETPGMSSGEDSPVAVSGR